MLQHSDLDAERADLHIKTVYSAMDALIQPHALIQKAEEMGLSAIAVTDTVTACAFEELWECSSNSSVKVIYGVDSYYKNDVDPILGAVDVKPLHITLLVQNEIGRKNLYHLISKAQLESSGEFPTMQKSDILRHREGIMIGSGGIDGEVFQALLCEKAADQIIDFYDYTELFPLDGIISSEEKSQYKQIYSRILKLSKVAGKAFVICSNAHFLNPGDELARRILLEKAGRNKDDWSAPLYLKSGNQLADEFAFLDDADVELALLTYPRQLADRCKKIPPIAKSAHYWPENSGAANELQAIIDSCAHKLYGKELPAVVKTRIDSELALIKSQGLDRMFLAVREIVENSWRQGFPAEAHLNDTCLLIPYLTGVAKTNPLSPNYRYRSDFNIPHSAVSKQGTITLRVTDEYRNEAHRQLRELIGYKNVIRLASPYCESKKSHEKTIVDPAGATLHQAPSASMDYSNVLSLQSKASELLSFIPPRTTMKALSSLYTELFGEKGDLYRSLEVIADGNNAKCDFVSQVLLNYCDIHEHTYTINSDLIDIGIDKAWLKVNGTNCKTLLHGPARQRVIQDMASRIKIMLDWLSQSDSLPSAHNNDSAAFSAHKPKNDIELIIPDGVEIEDYCPIQRFSSDTGLDLLVTQFKSSTLKKIFPQIIIEGSTEVAFWTNDTLAIKADCGNHSPTNKSHSDTTAVVEPSACSATSLGEQAHCQTAEPQKPEPSAKHVFISYSSRNASQADALYDFLKGENIPMWMAPNDIPDGSKYAGVINKAIEDCACFVLLLSEDAQNSSWVPKEVNIAIGAKRPILPYQISPVTLNSDFKLYLSDCQISNVKILPTERIDPAAKDIQRLLSSIRTCIDNDK